MSPARFLPALLAAFLLSFLPSCASTGPMNASASHVPDDFRPARRARLTPVAEGVPTCIQRGASMEFDPPTPEGGSWALVIGYAIAYVFYGIFWCFYSLGELIYEACDSRSSPPDDVPRDPYPRATTPP